VQNNNNTYAHYQQYALTHFRWILEWFGKFWTFMVECPVGQV